MNAADRELGPLNTAYRQPLCGRRQKDQHNERKRVMRLSTIPALILAGCVAAVLSFVALIRRIPLRAPHWAELVPPDAIGLLAMFWVVERIADF